MSPKQNKKNANSKGQAKKKNNQPRRVNQPRKIKTSIKSGGKVTGVGQALRSIGGVAGSFLGNAGIGRAAGAAVSKIFGQGDYQVKSNSLLSGGPPAFASMNTGMRVSHREYIADVKSSQTFTNTTYDVNVIKAATFPWLSRMAQNFEEYTIKGIVFYFNTTCGSAVSSTNNALGVVGMVTVYDPSDPPLSTKRECEDYSGCVAGVPSVSLIHPIECKPRSNVLDRLYMQNSTVNSIDDLKFFSHGTLNVFTEGMQAAGITVGELWVSYDVEFYNPRILPIGTYEMSTSRHYATLSNIDQYKVLGNTGLTFSQGNFKATYDASGYVHIPKGTASGYYLVEIWAKFNSGQVAPGMVASPFQNLTATAFFQGTASSRGANGLEYAHSATLFYKPDSGDGSYRWEFLSAPPQGTSNYVYDAVITKIPVSALTDVVVSSAFTAPSNRSDKFLAQIQEYIDSKFGLLQSQALRRTLVGDEEIPQLIREFQPSQITLPGQEVLSGFHKIPEKSVEEVIE